MITYLDETLIGKCVLVKAWADSSVGGTRVIKVENFERKGKNDKDVIDGEVILPESEAGEKRWAYTDQIMGEA